MPGIFLDATQDAGFHLQVNKWPWNFFSWQEDLFFLLNEELSVIIQGPSVKVTALVLECL